MAHRRAAHGALPQLPASPALQPRGACRVGARRSRCVHPGRADAPAAAREPAAARLARHRGARRGRV
eukprot:5730161-Prymnesium_polylepis.1